MTIYLRQPATTNLLAPTTRRLAQLGKRYTDGNDTISDKIEIDSDNIETPPVTRRVFSPPKDLKIRENVSDKNLDNNSYGDLGSGKYSFVIFLIIRQINFFF